MSFEGGDNIVKYTPMNLLSYESTMLQEAFFEVSAIPAAGRFRSHKNIGVCNDNHDSRNDPNIVLCRVIRQFRKDDLIASSA